MADSKVTIKIDADAEGAKRAFAEVQSSADAAMESGARSAQKLAKGLNDASDSAKDLTRGMNRAVSAIAGVAAGLATIAASRTGGDSAGADYLKGSLIPGLSAAIMAKNPYVGGAVALGGAVGTYFDRQERGRQQKEGVGDTVESLAKAREEMDRVAERTDNFEKLLQTLGNTTADAASREKLLADEIEKRKQGEDDAREKMKAAEAAMKSFQATIDGPMTRDQEKYFQTLQEDWKNAAKDLQTNRAERKQLEGQKIEKDKPNYDQTGTSNEKLGSLLSGLEKAGIGFAALATNTTNAKQAMGAFVSDYQQGGANDASTWVDRDEAANKPPEPEPKLEEEKPDTAASSDATSALEDFSRKVGAFNGIGPGSLIAAAIAEGFASTDRTGDTIAERGNDIAERSLAVLENIERNTGGAPTAVFA